jgi:SAM-dependent methyltransferase
MINYLKSYIASSKYFWKFRYNLIKNLSHSNKSKNYYSFINKIIFKLKTISILDYGCGLADLTFYLKNKNKDLKIIGVDLNQNVIEYNKKLFNKFKKNSFIFSNEINIDAIDIQKKKLKIKKFDLVIFDRVLYIMTDKDINILFDYLSKNAKYIYIDDFYLPNNYKSFYKHRDWDLMLKKYKFMPHSSFESPHKPMFHANSKSTLYKYK